MQPAVYHRGPSTHHMRTEGLLYWRQALHGAGADTNRTLCSLAIRDAIGSSDKHSQSPILQVPLACDAGQAQPATNAHVTSRSTPRRASAVNTLLLSAVMIAFLSGCSRGSEGPNQAAESLSPPPAKLSAIRGKPQLEQMIPLGTTGSQIQQLFGQPAFEETSGNNAVMWRYPVDPVDAEDDMKGTQLVAINILLTNGQVAFRGCSYVSASERLVKSPAKPAMKVGRPKSSPDIEIFSVGAEATAGRDTFINTEIFPRLGFVSRSPDLALREPIRIIPEETMETDVNPPITNWFFTIELTDADSIRLQSYTTTNLSKKVLVTIAGIPISAPLLVVPIQNGIMKVSCRDRVTANRVMQELTVKPVP